MEFTVIALEKLDICRSIAGNMGEGEVTKAFSAENGKELYQKRICEPSCTVGLLATTESVLSLWKPAEQQVCISSYVPDLSLKIC